MADYPDFEGAKSKLFTVADWAAVEATDKDVWGERITVLAFGEASSVAYTIPSGKTLYVTMLAFSLRANDAANGDKDQIGYGIADVDGTEVFGGGFNGGTAIALNKPLVVEAGEVITVYTYSFANHDARGGNGFSGYEVS